MEWTRPNTIGLSQVSCTRCQGLGMRLTHGGRDIPCECVYRAIFRACLKGFRESFTDVGVVNWEFNSTGSGRRMYGRKQEEFRADFALIGRRVLCDAEYEIFRFHFLLGADWRQCCRKLHMDRGTFFHSVYRIEERVGRTFGELKPYALYPVLEYFCSSIPSERVMRIAA